MIYTEEEARGIFCHRTIPISGGAYCEPAYCYTSRCSAWRWVEIADVGTATEVPKPTPQPSHDGQIRGYCGDAGRPNINTEL